MNFQKGYAYYNRITSQKGLQSIPLDMTNPQKFTHSYYTPIKPNTLPLKLNYNDPNAIQI